MGKCKTCKSGGVSGVGDAPYILLGTSIVGSVLAEKANEMLTKNADGTPKTNADGTPSYLVANPKIRDAGMLALGVAATMYADGNEMITGVGLGVAVRAGFSLVQSFMTPAASVSGYMQPASLGAIHVPGNAGYSPSSIGNYGRMNIPNQQKQYAAASGFKVEAA